MIRRSDEPKLALSEFIDAVRARLEFRTTDAVSADADISDDLGLDSVSMVELVCLIEDLGVYVDEGEILSFRTLRKIHNYYLSGPPVVGAEAEFKRGGPSVELM